MATLKYGIIGLGFFGEIHAEILSQMAGVELTAVCTRREQRLTEVAQKFGVPRTYTNYRDLLNDADIDAVSIVTHVNSHRDIAVDALNAGKHVFLEKPMAGSVIDCDAIISAAATSAGKFMVGHICRFDPRISLAKKAVDDGRIGKIVSMHATRNLPAQIGAEVLDKISPLMGDGIHDTDLMLWFTKGTVRTVYARTVRVRQFANPDIGWAMYSFADGAVGVTETIWCLPEKTPFTIDARMEIIGTDGAVYIDCGNAGLTIHDSDGISKPDTVYWPVVAGRRSGALRSELRYFIDCVNTGSSLDIITPEESRQAVEVICAAERSAATGQSVVIEPG